MTPEEMSALEAEERELMAKLEAVKAARRKAIDEENQRKAEELRLRNLEKPIEVRIEAFSGAMIIVKVSEQRDDVIALLRATPGRAFSYNDYRNSIPVASWNQFVEKLGELKNTKLTWLSDKLQEELEWYLNAPVWEVDRDFKQLLIKPGPRALTGIIYSVPGCNWVSERKLFTAPLTEAWQVWERLKDVDGTIWSEEARAYVVAQMERRANLDKVALMKRGVKFLDFDFDSNGVNKLRPFQEVGAEFIDAADGKALLADEMGLGKTWQVLAYMIKNKMRGFIVCPASLKPNWAREIRKLTGQRPVVLSGSEPTNHDLIKFLTSPPQFAIINYDIAGKKTEITKQTKDKEGFTHEEHQTRFLWIELINMSKPDMVILDEGHYIKNVDSNRSQALRKLNVPRVVCMTGTPVLNRPGELWPMLNLIAKDQFPAYETFLTQYTFDGKYAKNTEELRTLLRGIMIRRLKKDVMADLPPINRINEFHELSAKAEKIYRRVEEGIYEQLAEYSAKGIPTEKVVTNMLVQIGRLKQVCAIDKVDHSADLARRLYEETDESEPRKVIIFSQYKAVAYAIWQRLADDGALCFVTRGAHEFHTADNIRRDELVQQFQRDPNIKYLVVTEKTTKEGHNITAAGHVIFNDPFWTPAGHEQAEGRAYGRMDNPHSIGSYYVLADMDGESIDEWIMQLLARKLRVIHQTVEGVEEERDVSVIMDVIEKMKEKMFTRRKSA